MKRQKMRTEQKSNVKNSVGRLVFVGLSLLLQVLWILLLFLRLNAYSTAISLCFSVGAFLVALSIYAKHENAAFKMPWIILILAFPVLGLCIYLVFGHKNVVAKAMRRRFETIEPVLFEQIPQDEAVLGRLEEQDFAVANQCRYIKRFGHYPVYRNTDVTFYPDAAEGLAAQLHDLASAEHFIFMEYHAIEEAEAFGRIKDVLAERAAHGVEVRLFYDDVGSIGFIDPGFIKRMEAIGVECRVFNPVLPVLNIFMNNRDHRKITVVDGKIGYTGGYNLADEYFNIKSAKHFFYAATPYLIISDDMTRELCLAAERGVDVRIVTPGIPDKKLVYQTTRSYYAPLVRRGVRIYEYTPGFIHQKQTLCDGETATVGTINFDYRSLYHHFENGVLLHGCGALGAIGEDFEQIFEVSREVTEQYKGKRSMGLRIIQCILRLFAPLL